MGNSIARRSCAMSSGCFVVAMPFSNSVPLRPARPAVKSCCVCNARVGHFASCTAHARVSGRTGNLLDVGRLQRHIAEAGAVA